MNDREQLHTYTGIIFMGVVSGCGSHSVGRGSIYRRTVTVLKDKSHDVTHMFDFSSPSAAFQLPSPTHPLPPPRPFPLM